MNTQEALICHLWSSL